jgi:acyl-CoA synthetase (AMP-forming)/AMP-acid ligase II
VGNVEAVIYTHPAVREVAVFRILDPRWGKLVMACVVLKEGRWLGMVVKRMLRERFWVDRERTLG